MEHNHYSIERGLASLNKYSDWRPVLQPIIDEYGSEIEEQINADIKTFGGDLKIYPPCEDLFAAFRATSLANTKVVILGMDPYINPDEAHGLAFSVKNGKMTPSLRNIFKELDRSYGTMRTNTDLTDWAQQGVLLLNTALTVRQGASGSHTKFWANFSIKLMWWLGDNSQGRVFILWGNHAKQFESHINKKNNLVLTWTHPSPLSRKPFVGCDHFVKCNEYLSNLCKTPINWI